MSRTLNVPCTVDIERTPEALYAHVDLDGIELRPGDIVLIHDAPTSVDNGAHVVCQRQATVTRAGWIARLWAKVTAPFWLLVHD